MIDLESMGLSKIATHGILRAVCAESNTNEFIGLLESYILEEIIEFLKGCRDLPEFFPRGKWATIQRLQEIDKDKKP